MRNRSLRKAFAVCTLAAALASAPALQATPFCPPNTYCEPNCPAGVLCSICPVSVCVPPNTWCGCGQARLIEGTCLDLTDLSTCAWTCEGVRCRTGGGGGNCENAEMPFCEGTAAAICMGGTWQCDDSGSIGYSCSGTYPPFCQFGSFCYGNTWYCGDNPSGSCTGTAPTCPDPTDPLGQRTKPAICSSGLWYCA